MEFSFTGSVEEYNTVFRTPAEGHADILSRLDAQHALLENLMTSSAEVKVNVQKLRDDTDALGASFGKAWEYAKSVNDAKDAAIAELKSKVAGGEALVAADFADFDEINDDAVAADATVKAVISQLNSIGVKPEDPLPTPPVPIPPAPEPVPVEPA